MSRQVEFYLSIQNETGSPEENQAILGSLTRELVSADAEISAIASETAPLDLLEKGEGLGSVFEVKINLEALRSIATWIYQRLTPGVNVKFKHQAAEFEFEGRNQQELAAAMEQFEQFITALEGTH